MDSIIHTTEVAPRTRGLSKVVIGVVAGTAGAAGMIYLIICALHGKATADIPLTGSFTTRMGEHRCEKLPDVSAVCLNTNSEVRYTFNRRTRNVELVSGEASFTVHSKDPRPFDVLSGGVLIHDLSTSFDVYKRLRATLVTVIDGQVNVVAPISAGALHDFKKGAAESAWKSAPKFHRLQQVEYDEATGTLYARNSLTEEGLTQLLAWQRGRIDLNGRTLREALTEFSRYQPIDRFNIPDRSVRNRLMGGELESTNLTDFLDTLERTHGIHHTMTMSADGKITITLTHPRAAMAAPGGK